MTHEPLERLWLRRYSQTDEDGLFNLEDAREAETCTVPLVAGQVSLLCDVSCHVRGSEICYFQATLAEIIQCERSVFLLQTGSLITLVSGCS